MLQAQVQDAPFGMLPSSYYLTFGNKRTNKISFYLLNQ